MEIIKKEAVPSILPVAGGRDTRLRTMLLQLQPGDALFLPAAEWRNKRPPYNVVAYIKKTRGITFEYGRKADGSGWLFRRLS